MSKLTKNAHKLMNEDSIEKFMKMIQDILEGRYLYRTMDGRILDFDNGTETDIWTGVRY